MAPAFGFWAKADSKDCVTAKNLPEYWKQVIMQVLYCTVHVCFFSTAFLMRMRIQLKKLIKNYIQRVFCS